MREEKVRNAQEIVKRFRKILEEKVKDTSIIVVLLGAGGRGLKKRRKIRAKLEEEGVIAIIPEDDFPAEEAPSVAEEAVFAEEDVDLIYVDVESWGSATEFTQFHEKKTTAHKLRVLTRQEYHPLYGASQSYLTDLYLSHLAVYGHVYAYSEEGCFPPPEEIILKLSRRYKKLKALGKI